MDQINKLTEVSKRLKAGEDPESVKEEAQAFVASINPTDLSLGEQKLIEMGIAPEDLRHLCSAHMEMPEDKLEKMKGNIEPGHVIHTLVSEHEIILGFLDELDKTNQNIQEMEDYSRENEEFKKLANIADHLIGVEPHKEREEKIIFPAIEKEGVFGLTQIMKAEHEDLTIQKKYLKELVENVGEMDFTVFKKRLDTTSKSIIVTLKDHIFKENSILYPTALEVIMTWDKIKSGCDEIGYCCFTPEV